MSLILLEDLTTKALDGTGVFDELMSTTQLRLEEEYAKGRIKGSEYSTVYLGAMQSVMQQSLAFLMGKQQADVQAELTKAQTSVANQQLINLVTENDTAKKQGLLVVEQVLKLQQEIQLGAKQEDLLDAQILKTSQETLVLANNVLKGDQEVLVLEKQILKTAAEVDILGKQEDLLDSDILKAAEEVLISKNTLLKSAEEVLVMAEEVKKAYAEALLLNKQVDKITIDTANATSEAVTIVRNQEKLKAERQLLNQKYYTELANIADSFNFKDPITGLITGDYEITGVLGKQLTKLDAEGTLLSNKSDTEKASITDTVNAMPVAGVIGKQKKLYAAQADGFTRDAEQKLAKIYADSWSVRRSTDEATGANAAALGDAQAAKVMNKAALGINVILDSTPNT